MKKAMKNTVIIANFQWSGLRLILSEQVRIEIKQWHSQFVFYLVHSLTQLSR